MTLRIYNQSMYKFDTPESSLWEASQGARIPHSIKLMGDHSADVAIIGGGYTGLSAAYHLAKDFNVKSSVIEAGHIGWGASGRNGGFCSVGGTAEDNQTLIKKYGLDDVKKYYQSQIDAIELVRSIILDEKIDIKIQGNAEIEVARSSRDFDRLVSYANFRKKSLGLNTSIIPEDRFKEEYFDSTEQYGAISIEPTFGIHPLRFVNGLADAASNRGVNLYSNSEVISWEKTNNGHLLSTNKGSITAKYVIFATNGFMPEHLLPNFNARSLPIISSIITTRPLTEDELNSHNWKTEDPIINSRKLVNYFRMLPDNRFLFGGRGSSSGNQQGALKNYRYLESVMKKIWPNWRSVDIEYKWHGFVCFTKRLTPSIGRLDDDPSVFFGFGYHGNGVNTSTWTGYQLAKWVGKINVRSEYPEELPNLIRGLSPKFPLSSFRRYYLQAMINFYRFKDNFDFFSK